MTRRLACLALLALASLAPACSALVSPDQSRLQPDGGVVMQLDGTIPGVDAWSPGNDSGLPADDTGLPGNDAWSPPIDTGSPCGAGQVLCGGNCVLLSNDTNNCGHCFRQCNPGATCVSGVCMGGTAPSPLGNPSDCGPSHVTCGTLEVCWMGTCRCRPPYQNAGGGTCVDFNTDPQNCGMPPVDCGGGTCYQGHCIPNCPFLMGVMDCNGACVQTRSDPGNCGGCGITCTGSQVCVPPGACHDVTVPAACNTCPCAECNGQTCCHWSAFNATACVAGVSSCG